MGHKHLERRIKLLKGFMDLWKELHDVLECVSNTRQISEGGEESFLKIKAEIARQQARMSEILELDSHFGDEVIGVVSQVISLKDYLTLSSLQIKRIETQWHNLFILMHGQLGKYEAIRGGFSAKWIARFLRNPFVILGWFIGGLICFYFLGRQLLMK